MKSVIVHGVLAMLGLLLAYRTATREDKEEPRPGEVTIAECEPSQLTSIEIETPTHTTVYRSTPARDGTAYWVTTTPKKRESALPATAHDKQPPPPKPADKAEPKPDAKAQPPAAAQKPPAESKPPRAIDSNAPLNFLASKRFDDVLKSLAPLRAVRGLGEIPTRRFSEFGFDKVGTYLRVSCGKREVRLEIGGRTFGSGDQYARDPKTKQAYLMGGQLLMDLQSAQFKFMQTDLHEFPLSDVDEVVIKAAGRERRLSHRNRLVKEDAHWVDTAAPDKRNELFGNWLERLERLKVKSYLGDKKEPGSDLQIETNAMVPVLTLEYRLEGKQKGKLELVRVDSSQGGLYYARSDATQRWTTMYDSLAKQVEDDVALVVGAEERSASPHPVAPAAPQQGEKEPARVPRPAAPNHPR